MKVDAMKVLSCPFCGKLPKVWQDEEMYPSGPVPTDWIVECCVVMCGGDKNEVIKKWNTRRRRGETIVRDNIGGDRSSLERGDAASGEADSTATR